jgi:hypothetical protein
MTLKVMTSTEKAGGPKNLGKKLIFVLFNENEETSTLIVLKMQKHSKINSPYCMKRS